MRKLPVVAVVALLAGLGGCGDETGPGSGARPAPTVHETTQGNRTIDPAAARDALKSALAAITAENVTWFRAVSAFDGEEVLVTEGFATAGGSWSATTTFTITSDPDAGRVMLSRSARGSVWMQMTDWPPPDAGCWMAMTSTQVPMGLTALQPVEPTFISILGSLSATGFTSSKKDTLAADLGLGAAVTLLKSDMLHTVDVTSPRNGNIPVKVEVGVTGGRLTEVRMRGSALLDALKQAGASLGEDMEEFLGIVSISVEYPSRSGNPQVSPPPVDLVMHAGDEGCHSG